MTATDKIAIPILGDELKSRVKIALFMILSLQLSMVISPPIQNVAVLMTLAALVDLVSISIIAKICNNKNVGRDINELNLYSVIIHLIAIPAYYYTEIPTEYHNYAIWFLFGLAILRLFYFGKKTEDNDYQGLPTFGLLGYFRKAIAKTRQMPFKYYPDILFFGSAVPLWFIIFQTNEQAITITVIGAMLFIYLISDAIKKQATNTRHIELSEDETRLLEIFKSKSSREKALILSHAGTGFAAIAAEAEINKAKQIDDAKYLGYKIAAGTLLVLLIALAASTFGGIPQARSDYYRFGYKQGFLDAKEGKRQLTAAERERHVACHLHDQQTNPPGPSDPFCNE